MDSYNEGDTLTHELGHYLNLDHTFNGGCSGGDSVDDTPWEKNERYGCPSSAVSSCGSVDPVHNFMDYTDDHCMCTFTAGQHARVWAALEECFPEIYAAATPQGPTPPPTPPTPSPPTPPPTPSPPVAACQYSGESPPVCDEPTYCDVGSDCDCGSVPLGGCSDSAGCAGKKSKHDAWCTKKCDKAVASKCHKKCGSKCDDMCMCNSMPELFCDGKKWKHYAWCNKKCDNGNKCHKKCSKKCISDCACVTRRLGGSSRLV